MIETKDLRRLARQNASAFDAWVQGIQNDRSKLIELLKCSRAKKNRYEADTVLKFYAAVDACSDISIGEDAG